MNINYIKYIDPRSINNNNFETTKDLEGYKARTVEAVGYLVCEDEYSVYISMQYNGSSFRKLLFIPKNNIVERFVDYLATGEAIVDGRVIAERVFVDAQMTSQNVSITIDKLKSIGKPEPVHTVGFIVRDTDEDFVLAMEKNEDGKFRTQVILPKILPKQF